MSDEKKNGDNRIAWLVDKVKNRHAKGDSPEEPVPPADEVEFHVEDPTREQSTPPELTDQVEHEETLELDEDDERKGNFISRMSLTQRIVLCVVAAIAFIGVQKTLSGKEDLDYLNDQGQTQPMANTNAPAGAAPQEIETPSSPASDDGFEPIDQGSIAPDQNALNLTGNEVPSDTLASDAFSMDPIEQAEGPDNSTGESMDSSEGGEATDQDTASTPEASDRSDESFDLAPDSFASSDNSEPRGTSSTIPPQDFSQSGLTDSQIEQIQSDIGNLNSELSALSQSVVSIKEEMSSTASANRELVTQVSQLMEALEKREEQVKQMESRPEIRDLVIFRAASDCRNCVPHAFFTWNGKEIEVGDGLQWQGYEVAIRGDRMTLLNDQDTHHYWYR